MSDDRRAAKRAAIKNKLETAGLLGDEAIDQERKAGEQRPLKPVAHSTQLAYDTLLLELEVWCEDRYPERFQSYMALDGERLSTIWQSHGSQLRYQGAEDDRERENTRAQEQFVPTNSNEQFIQGPLCTEVGLDSVPRAWSSVRLHDHEDMPEAKRPRMSDESKLHKFSLAGATKPLLEDRLQALGLGTSGGKADYQKRLLKALEYNFPRGKAYEAMAREKLVRECEERMIAWGGQIKAKMRDSEELKRRLKLFDDNYERIKRGEAVSGVGSRALAGIKQG
ncbi:hypothetical protein IAR55_005056 [Kwoniella newhampshirensis]|uniref:SAP domain-containing protein n=1 Tax=Kwoniella newhampshirensis TaxID=1651941 RepID=A0AAW0YJW4_9TREE